MAKIMKPADAEPAEHPDDRASRLKSEAWAVGTIKEFAAKHASELAALIQTYADAEAQEKLEELRDKFWSMPQ